MRSATKDGMRQTGYTITVAIVLLALFCLLAGDQWAAGTLGLTAAVSVAAMEMLRKATSRRL
jgi:hypothetical protein